MQYAWFLWSAGLLAIWFVVYAMLPTRAQRRQLVIVSFWTSLLGITEPIFVPEYWNPPSLFGLAQSTGFDIESFMFAFGVGGVSVLYDVFFPQVRHPMSRAVCHGARHRFHVFALWSGPATFVLLLLFSDLNPIYSVIAGLAVGSVASILCRPDLLKKMLFTGPVFFVVYFLYFLSLVLVFPSFVETVWNLQRLSGILFAGIPLEELVFALFFGFYWASIYEHASMSVLSPYIAPTRGGRGHA